MLHPSVLPVIGGPRGYNLYQYTGNIGQKNMRTSSTCLWCRATCLPIFIELPPCQALAANIEASLRRLSRSSHRSFSLAGALSLAKPISLVAVPCESSEGTKAIPWRFAAVGRLRLAQHSSHFVAEKAGVQEDDGSPGHSHTFLGKGCFGEEATPDDTKQPSIQRPHLLRDRTEIQGQGHRLLEARLRAGITGHPEKDVSALPALSSLYSDVLRRIS